MDKIVVMLKLDMIVVDRLFGSEGWSLDDDTSTELMRALEELGLEERLGDEGWSWTPLGKELHVDLHMAFIGLFCDWEVILHLESYNLVEEDEAEEIIELLAADKYSASRLRSRVQRAYCGYHRLSRIRH
jgi:hypothetical protein